MAIVYGGKAGGLGAQLYIDYSTSSTATSYTISIKCGWYQYDTDPVSAGSGADGTLSGSLSGSYSISTAHPFTKGKYYQLVSTSKTYTKTTSTQSFSITWNSSTITDMGGTKATLSITVPALASYNVTYNANGGSGAPGTQKKYYGKTLTLSSTKPTRAGYTFVRWNTSTSNTGTAYSPGGTYTGNAALTLYAIWKANTYTVTFNANGGSGAPSAQTKTYGVNLTLSSTRPTRTGYTFLRWSTNSGGTGTTYNPGGTYSANAAVTLYAIWQINTWTVSYNANGGSGQPANQTKTYGTALTLSSTKPTRTGYTFKTWNTSSSGTGTNYSPGGSYTGNAALTLYAIWKINTYAVTYNANGGTGAPAGQTKTYGANLTLSTTTPTRADYRFVSWNTAANGSGTSYAPGATYTGNAALTLYAIWESTYTAPKITDVVAYRSDSGGNSTEEGTYGFVSFSWSPGADSSGDVYPTAIQVGYREKGTTTYTYVSVSDIVSGTGSAIVGGAFAVDKMYDIIVVLTPAGTGRANVTKTTYISVASFIIDVNADGTAVAIGMQAPDDMEGFVMGFDPYIALDTSAASGTVDAALYDAIRALGWEDDVII